MKVVDNAKTCAKLFPMHRLKLKKNDLSLS